MTVLQARDGLTMSRWIETVHWPVLSLRPGAGAFTLLRVLPPLLALVTACELVFAAQRTCRSGQQDATQTLLMQQACVADQQCRTAIRAI